MNIRLTFLRWMPKAVLITALCFLVYVAFQQDIRSSANDPQVQLAEDAALAGSRGMSAKEIALTFGGTLSDNPKALDISKTLSPFVIVFNQSGGILASSASLAEVVPTPPVGVFVYTDKNKTDRFTWQPIPQVRIAAVMIKIETDKNISTTTDNTNGFILVGRSLREVEMRQKVVLSQVSLVWIILLILSLGFSIFITSKSSDNKG